MNSRCAFFLLVGLLNACSPKYPPPPGFVDACYGGNFSKRLAGATPMLYLRIQASPKTWPELAQRFAAFGALHDLRYFDTSISEPGLRMLNIHLCSAKGVWLSADKRIWADGPIDPHPDEMPITLYTYRDYDGQMLASECRQFLSDWPGGVNTGLPSGETIRLTSSP
jgi:hypothetical protein